MPDAKWQLLHGNVSNKLPNRHQTLLIEEDFMALSV
jgi:hypothetical protein